MRHVFYCHEVFWCVLCPDTTFIVTKNHVHNPVQAMVSRPEGFHLQPLAERCGSLSTHTAPIKRGLVIFRLCQCANRSGCRSAIRATKRLARVLCPFSRLYF